MSHSKPQVTIDLEEYNELLKLKEARSKELDYERAYSEFITALEVPMNQLMRAMEYANNRSPYIFELIDGVNSHRFLNIKVRFKLDTNGKIS